MRKIGSTVFWALVFTLSLTAHQGNAESKKRYIGPVEDLDPPRPIARPKSNAHPSSRARKTSEPQWHGNHPGQVPSDEVDCGQVYGHNIYNMNRAQLKEEMRKTLASKQKAERMAEFATGADEASKQGATFEGYMNYIEELNRDIATIACRMQNTSRQHHASSDRKNKGTDMQLGIESPTLIHSDSNSSPASSRGSTGQKAE